MLSELAIKNFAIIEELSLSFSKGFNVLSGETGAGKSIIVNAIHLLQGGRTSPEIIRCSEKEATVEALFDISNNHAVSEKIETLGLEKEENLVVKRVVSHSGKSKVFINGGLATLSMLASLGRDLITISGQHENQLLLDTERHIDILDDFGALSSAREWVRGLFRQFLTLSRELAEMVRACEMKEERKSLLDFQYNEIERAMLQKGEEESLRKKRDILLNAEKLLEYSRKGYDVLYEGKESVIENLKGVQKNVKDISQIDDFFCPLIPSMESSIIELEDIAFALRDFSKKIEFDPVQLEGVQQRLLEINKLKKFGSTVDEILLYKESLKRELNDLLQEGNNTAKKREEMAALKRELLPLAQDLSKKRKSVAHNLKSSVEKELWSLGMEGTVFEVDIKTLCSENSGDAGGNTGIDKLAMTEKGMDHVEFLFSPNPGEPPRALSRIASGGELSRVILALKSILAQKGGVEALVFDEVDTGIGGRVADIVGQKLKSISRFHQVLCITHLPQIARFADTHYYISKGLKNGRTVTSVTGLGKEERIGEIARMLGGQKVTETVLKSAREMIDMEK